MNFPPFKMITMYDESQSTIATDSTLLPTVSMEKNDILEEVDTFLSHLEDFTHGEDGRKITELRGKIQSLIQIKK
jgi:hypothetical protein